MGSDEVMCFTYVFKISTSNISYLRPEMIDKQTQKQTSNIAGSKSFGFLVSPFNTYNQETNNSLKQKLENKTCTFRYSERQNG